MRVVSAPNTTVDTLNKQQEYMITDNKDQITVPFHQSTLGTIHKKKPLPKIPMNKLSEEPVYDGFWTTTNQFNNEQFYFTELPLQQSNPHLLLTQEHYEVVYNNDMNNWKTNIHRSDSLKIETIPVPFLKNGYLPLETHLEKPFEPTLDDIQALNRKVSKEEISILLQKLDESSVQFNNNNSSSSSSSSSSSELISTPQTSISSYSIHRHSMPLLITQQEEHHNSSPVSSRIPSPWGTSRSATLIKQRASIHSISVQVANEIEDQVTKANNNKAEQYFNEEDNNRSKCTLSIASCSLIHMKSNTKLYRRMAIKTRNKETQMTYARYLLQISKLYEKNMIVPIASSSSVSLPLKKTNSSKSIETPADTRHRLLSEAGYWIERLAKVGQPEALYIKGKWHLLGPLAEDCVLAGYEKVQENKAFKCFLTSSKAGWVDSHYELAHLWKKRGNYAKAIECYEKGAKEKHTLSIYKMAKILLRGQLKKKKNIPKGMAYLKEAADMEDSFSAEPAFVLGCIQANEFERIGIQKCAVTAIEDDSSNKVNYSLALKYLKKSAQYGYPDAIYFMGQVSEKGMLGQLCDSWQAYQNYMKAAEVNHAGAMLDLSRIYSQGIPGLLSAQKDMAFKWCKRSADLGFDQAEYVLGKYYEDGIGIAPDFPLALEYFGKAASKGYQLAAEKLNRPLADGTRRFKKGGQKQNYLSVVISEPRVKRDDDDDSEDELNKKHYTRENNICTIQ